MTTTELVGPTVGPLNLTEDIDQERKLCRKLVRAIEGVPLPIALNAVGRTMHALQIQLQMIQQQAQEARREESRRTSGPAIVASAD